MRPAILVMATALLTAACGSQTDAGPAPSGSPAANARPTVVAAFAPLATVATEIGGSAVDVTLLTPPGAEPHDLELSAAQVAQISEADLVLYVKGFQPAVDEAVAQHAADHAIDVSERLDLRTADDHGHEHEGESADEHAHESGTDPHVWLSPRNMEAIGSVVADRLATLVPGADIDANRQAFASQMSDLDTAFRDGLKDCKSRIIVVSHEAFGYMADAYGLEQVGISGLAPEAEPSPARLAAVAEVVRNNKVGTIYTERLVDPKVAKTLADEVGVTTAVLDPIEGIPQSSTYDSIMRQNLAALRSGQACS